VRGGDVLPSWNRTARAAIDVVTIALFLSAVLAPTIDQMLRPDSARDPRRENRKMRPRPERPRTLAALNAFPLAYEGHYADSFGLRDVLLRWNSYDKVRVFHTSPTPSIVLADHGWVDYAAEDSMEILRGLEPMTIDELYAWQDYLERCRAFCARNEAHYLFLVCPNKETIYPEHVPARYERLGSTRFEQLMAFLPAELKACIVDVRADFLAAKTHDVPPDDYLYNVSGTHWNGRGTWTAYQAVVRAMRPFRPEIQALPEGSATFTPDPFPSGDSWGEHLYARELFPQPSRQITLDRPLLQETLEGTLGGTPRWHARNSGLPGPRVLVFHDSFGPPLGYMLAESCSDLTLAATWFDPQQIQIEQPEVVLEVRVERRLRVQPFVDDLGRVLSQAEDVPPPKEGRILLSIDASTPGPGFTTIGKARVERAEDAVVFRAEESTAAWTLPEFTVAEGQRAWLRVDLESDAGGILIAYRRAPDTGKWMRHDAGYLPYSKGRQSRTIALPGPAGAREIRLHLFDPPAQVRVKKLEVRVTGP
jgi:hypothetical protein